LIYLYCGTNKKAVVESGYGILRIDFLIM